MANFSLKFSLVVHGGMMWFYSPTRSMLPYIDIDSTGIKRFWMYMWTNLERTVSYEGNHYNQSDQVVLLWHLYKINYNNKKKSFLTSLCHLNERLSLVTYKQRAVHFIPMMWFDFIRWRFHFIRGRFHYLNCIKHNQNDVTQNCI